MGHVTETIFVTVERANGRTDASGIIRAASDVWESGDNWGSEQPYFDNGDFAPTMTNAAANRWISKHDRDKAGIFPVVADENAVTSTKKVKLNLDGQAVEKLRAANGGVDYMLFEKLSDEHGRNLVAAVVTKLPRQRKAVSKSTEGKVITNYEIVSTDNNFVRVIKRGFVSKVEARDEAIRIVNSDDANEKGITILSVRAYLARENNDESLMVISRPVSEQAEIELTLTFETPKDRAPLAGWYVLADRHM